MHQARELEKENKQKLRKMPHRTGIHRGRRRGRRRGKRKLLDLVAREGLFEQVACQDRDRPPKYLQRRRAPAQQVTFLNSQQLSAAECMRERKADLRRDHIKDYAPQRNHPTRLQGKGSLC